jgi:DNA-binding beta-propeller fold protein YncE
MVSASFAQDTQRRGLGYYYMQGRAAYQKKDYQAFLDNFKKAAEVAPNHLEVMYNLARGHALVGNKAEALAILSKIVGLGLSMDIQENKDFDSIRASNEFKQLMIRVEKAGKPVGNSTTAFTIPERDLIPEGMAYDPTTRHFYLGSIHKRKIVGIDKSGKSKDFTKERQDGLWGVLGMKVDVRRNVLWANSAAGPEEKEFNGYSGVFKYDLATRKLIRKYVLDNKPQGHLLNDLAINSRGDVFITDSATGAVYMISQQRDELELFVQPGEFIYPNGITLSDDEKRLFVADWSKGISVISIDSRSVVPLSHPENVTLAGIDGLYFYENSLIAVQNGPSPARVIRFLLNADMNRVESANTIESNNTLFSIPTTGAITGGAFYYIANSHIDVYKDGVFTSVEKLRPVTILKSPLKKNKYGGL